MPGGVSDPQIAPVAQPGRPSARRTGRQRANAAAMDVDASPGETTAVKVPRATMAEGIPPALRERLRSAEGGALPEPRAGAHVLYLMRACLREETNPALDVALRAAGSAGLPLVCLAVVEDSYPPSMRPRRPPTDRAATFRLQALRELQEPFAQRGTCLWVHVERDGARQAFGMSLACRAALVVAEDHFGVEPHATAIARVGRTGVPLWLCDCHCTLPASLVPPAAMRGGNRAFLQATASLRAERLRAGWFPAPAPPPAIPPPPPPPWSLDLAGEGAIPSVLALPSRRDSSVRPVSHTRGGPRAAAARWRQYVSGGGVRSYASHRNNPLARDGLGACRMSAYLNLGMIDPRTVAVDAAGSQKFLDEFLGFREAPYVWCALHPGDYARAARAVPEWARAQLAGAAGARAVSLAEVETGRTGDVLWDECQRALHAGGELHNNLRMAWGKAVPAWWAAALPATESRPPSGIPPAERLQLALDLLLRLNDDFALDGGAPPSYGGLLWCLGWRDRPGAACKPKPRPTSVMASKIRPGDLATQLARREAAAGATEAAGLAGAGATATAAPAPAAAQQHGGRESPAPKRLKGMAAEGHAIPRGATAGTAAPSHITKPASPLPQTSILRHFRVAREAETAG